EDVPDIEGEYVQQRLEEHVRQTGTQNAERTCRICLSGAEDGTGSLHLCFRLHLYVCTCVSCPLRRSSAFPFSRALFIYCGFKGRSLTPGRLISPCRCRGTMKFVHLHCLNSWRYASPNRRSVYQCDQCGYKYHFNRTHYAAIASSIYTRVCSLILLKFS